jgi:hypothetical protein
MGKTLENLEEAPNVQFHTNVREPLFFGIKLQRLYSLLVSRSYMNGGHETYLVRS